MNFFYYASKFKIIFFGGAGGGPRVSEFFSSKNPNLKKIILGAGWLKLVIFFQRTQI